MKCAKNANSAIVFVGALRPPNIAKNMRDGLGVLDVLEIGWGPKTSAVCMTARLPTGRAPIKKSLPPYPPVVTRCRSRWADNRTNDQHVVHRLMAN